MRNRYVKSSAALRKKISSFLDSSWGTHSMTKLPQGSMLPKWLTIEPLEDGSYVVLKDALVQEMFDAYAERLPKYNEEKLKPFLKKEPETVMHGDFHPANHMFGVNENE